MNGRTRQASGLDAVREKLRRAFFPAVPVPFTKDGAIHREAQEAYARHMARQPVTGVAVWAHTGRGLFLSSEEREYIFRSWRAALGRDRMIICGVGARAGADADDDNEFRQKTIGMAEQARSLGADALLVYPPTIYRGTASRTDRDDRIVEYHRAVAELGVPMLAFYLYEAAGGIDYSPGVLRRLFALPQMVGIKMATLDSVMTYQDVALLIRRDHPGIRLITGEDRMLGYTIARGADGALVGLGAACTAPQVRMLRAFAEGRSEDFLRLMLQVDRLAECTFIHPMEGYIERMLYLLVLEGVIPAEAAYDPFGPGITEAERGAIRETFESLRGSFNLDG